MIKRILILIGVILILAIAGIFIALLSNDNVVKTGLLIGEKAPVFSGINQDGEELTLTELVEKGPVVLIFYRGYWCPYCNKHLSEIQDSLNLILHKGASVIAISPEKNEFVNKSVRQTKASFSILSDSNYLIMKKYKVDYKVATMKVMAYKLFKMDINKANGDNSNILPVPATYIIGADGKIKWIHFNPEYKKRANIKEIILNL
jgi:peroxiredoxin